MPVKDFLRRCQQIEIGDKPEHELKYTNELVEALNKLSESINKSTEDLTIMAKENDSSAGESLELAHATYKANLDKLSESINKLTENLTIMVKENDNSARESLELAHATYKVDRNSYRVALASLIFTIIVSSAFYAVGAFAYGKLENIFIDLTQYVATNTNQRILTEGDFSRLSAQCLNYKIDALGDNEREDLKKLIEEEKDYPTAISSLDKLINNINGNNPMAEAEALYIKALLHSLNNDYNGAAESFYKSFKIFEKNKYTVEMEIWNCMVGLRRISKKMGEGNDYDKWAKESTDFIISELDEEQQNFYDLESWFYR